MIIEPSFHKYLPMVYGTEQLNVTSNATKMLCFHHGFLNPFNTHDPAQHQQFLSAILNIFTSF